MIGKNLILLGAGASHGSDDAIVTPPLGGSELFDALASFDPPGWGNLAKAQAALFGEDFEKGMESIAEIRPNILFPLQKAMAKYFFEFEPQSSNLYSKLANVIRNRKVDAKFATLNYERLLEMSLKAAGFKMSDSRGRAQDNIEVCFPHGCCNFFHKSIVAATHTGFSMTDTDDGTSIKLGFGVTRGGTTPIGIVSGSTTQGGVEKVTDGDDFICRLSGDVFPPVMSYFVPSKYTTSGTDFIKEQRERFSQLVAEATKVIIIGLQVREHDTHIWQPLGETDCEIVYCSGATAGQRFQTWCEEYRKGKEHTVLSCYFGDGFAQLCSHLQ